MRKDLRQAKLLGTRTHILKYIIQNIYSYKNHYLHRIIDYKKILASTKVFIINDKM